MKLSEMLNDLPENRPLYKDSGLWQIWDHEDWNDVLYQQELNETFKEFIRRCYESENIWKDDKKNK